MENRMNDQLWFPVSGNTFADAQMKAAYIVPYAVGEVNAAYLFGRKPDEGYEEIWSERNGLMLHHGIEKVFDDGRIFIVRLPADQTGAGKRISNAGKKG
jgi:hypothetical protein